MGKKSSPFSKRKEVNNKYGYKGGGPWAVIEGIELVFVAVGSSLVVLFFVIGLILSILVYTFFSRMFDLMLPPVAKHSIVVA